MTTRKSPDFGQLLKSSALMVADVLERLPPESAARVGEILGRGGTAEVVIRVIPKPRIVLTVTAADDSRLELCEVALSPKAGELAH